MHELEVTTFTAAVCGLILLWLSVRVVRLRFSRRISIGDGGDALLTERMRSQANFVEYVPLLLILMGLIERAVGYSVALGVISGIIILSRLVHPIGMARPAPNAFRAGGMAGTWLSLIVLSIWALVVALRII